MPARLLQFLLVGLLALAAGSAEAQRSRPLKLVVLGDSLSAGFFLSAAQSFPAVLESNLRARGLQVSVIGAAVVNDASWDGLARMERDIPPDADAVIVELGANDMIRMASPSTTYASLDQIVSRLRARRIPVLIAGFRMPIAWGHDAAGFEQVFRTVAQRHRAAYYPDFYAGLWSDRSYRLLDGVHPSAAGVERIVTGILPTVTRFLGSIRTPASSVSRSRGSRGARFSGLPQP